MRHYYCVKMIGKEIYFDIMPADENPDKNVVIKVDWPVLFELLPYARRVHTETKKLNPNAEIVSVMVTVLDRVTHV